MLTRFLGKWLAFHLYFLILWYTIPVFVWLILVVTDSCFLLGYIPLGWVTISKLLMFTFLAHSSFIPLGFIHSQLTGGYKGKA